MKTSFRILASLLFLASTFAALGQPTPNVLKNPWSTNLSGTPVYGVNNLSVTNQNDKRWNFYGTNAETVARLFDVTNDTGHIKSLNGQGTNTSIRSSDANSIPFQVRTNVASTTPVFLVNSNGNIGIGTSNPHQAITLVQKTPGVNMLVSVTNGATETFFGLVGGGTAFGMGTASDSPNIFYSGNTEVMRIAQSAYNRYVGIGTTIPASKLHVADSSLNSTPGIRISDDLQSWAFRVKGDEYDQLQFVNINNGFVPMTIASNCVSDTLVLTNGNAGIGTNAPTAKLEVYGRIQGAYGSATCSTGIVTVATSASTNLFRGFNYAKTYATISMATNTTFVMANAGDVLVSFGARIGGANGNTLRLQCWTNGVLCSLAMINFTATATALDESAFKQFVVSLPAAATIDLRVANTAAANTTLDQVCFNVMGPN